MKQFLPDMAPMASIWVAKLVGALAGSAISVAYVLPRGKREAAIRFLTGVTAGLVFGLPVGIWLAQRLAITPMLGEAEIALMGAAFSSLTIWTALGVAKHFAERNTGKRPKSSTTSNTGGADADKS